MDQHQLPEKKNSTTKKIHNPIIPATPTCTNCSSFFCIMSETDPSLRRSKIARYFKQMPNSDHREHVLALSSLWKIAVTKPNDPEFPSLGIFRCMAKLIQKGVSDENWLHRNQNMYIPYYAAHIIGSYTMNRANFSVKAVKSNVVHPLMELLRGKMSWVEQRVALRALGHIASHEATFEAVAKYEAEIIEITVNLPSTCIDEVYEKFVVLKETERLEYHRDLITRGHGGLELENRKAEEWASQIQCWSLFLLDCFACRGRLLSLRLICNSKEFLKGLCSIWGGLANPTSPSGIGLLRTLCHTRIGRESVADLEEVVVSLCHVARSSDERQDMAIESLIQLVKDPITRYRVMDNAAPILADLVELKRGEIRLGQAIMRVLLQDYHKIKFGKLNLKSERTKRTLEELWDLKVERVKRESLVSEQEMKEKEVEAGALKRQGNRAFWHGNVEEAITKYSEALDLCPVKIRKERVVLHSNRAQCYLVLGDADAAIGDSTRALCLSSAAARSVHAKSLWRRAQAYDMKGLAKESLLDCLAFVGNRFGSRKAKGFKIPYYVVRMINKQMNATWLFSEAESNWCSSVHDEQKELMERNKV